MERPFSSRNASRLYLTEVRSLSSTGIGDRFAPQGSWVVQSHQVGNQIQSQALVVDPLDPLSDLGFILKTQLSAHPAQPLTSIWTTSQNCKFKLLIVAHALFAECIVRIAD